MTLDELALCPKGTLTTEQLAVLLGVDRDSIDKARLDGSFPIQAIRVGRKVLWPTLAVKRLLGVEERSR